MSPVSAAAVADQTHAGRASSIRRVLTFCAILLVGLFRRAGRWLDQRQQEGVPTP